VNITHSAENNWEDGRGRRASIAKDLKNKKFVLFYTCRGLWDMQCIVHDSGSNQFPLLFNSSQITVLFLLFAVSQMDVSL
jgi:hypothetical protein